MSKHFGTGRVRTWQASVLASLLFAISTAVQSQSGTAPEEPSTQSIIDALKPEVGVSHGRTRGLSLELPVPDVNKPKRHNSAPVVEARHVDLQVQFDFDSDQLTTDGRELLGKLGQALASRELAGVSSVTIEGHTDGTGSAAYNKALSLRRAQAVRSFLQTLPELGSKRFRVVGKGASELLRPDDPANGINRRVRVLVFHAQDSGKVQP